MYHRLRKEADPVADIVRPVSTPVTMERIPKKKPGKKYPILGGRLIPQLYSYVSILGSVGAGKTEWIYNLIRKRAGPRSVVIIYSTTTHNDDSWIGIIEWMKANNVPHIIKNSIYEVDKNGNKHDTVKEFIDGLDKQGEKDLAEREAENGEAEFKATPDKPRMFGGFWDEPHPSDREVKKEKKFLPTLDPYLVKVDGTTYQYQPFIVIFDDIHEELKAAVMSRLAKRFRHFHILLCTASQHHVDSEPGSRAQVKHWILFGGLSPDKLKLIYDASAPPRCSLQKFIRRYKDATSEKYSYYYFNVADGKMSANHQREYISLDPAQRG